MKYRPIDDDFACVDGSIDAYENCAFILDELTKE